MRLTLRMLVFCTSVFATSSGCQSTSTGKGIADSCYQPLYWPSKACPPGKK